MVVKADLPNNVRRKNVLYIFISDLYLKFRIICDVIAIFTLTFLRGLHEMKCSAILSVIYLT